MFSNIFPQIGLLYTNIPRPNCATRLILQAAEASRNHTYAAEMSNTMLPQPLKKTVAECTFAVDFSAGMWYSRSRREQAGSYPN